MACQWHLSLSQPWTFLLNRFLLWIRPWSRHILVGFTLNAKRGASSSGNGMWMLSPVRGTSPLWPFLLAFADF
jgi:hypothetical protein